MSKVQQTRHVLIVGGGTAGWLTASILAAKLAGSVKISVIESPDIATVGVGEGTWPTMQSTLKAIGVNETDFLGACHASFKQGSKFVGWKHGDGDYYYHPFDLPNGYYQANLAPLWICGEFASKSFSKTVSIQEYLCEKSLSPKLITSRDYSGVANYGYHLDAGKFSIFLRSHCIKNLGVELIPDKITQVHSSENGDIAHVMSEKNGSLAADLFIDCTGFQSLLIGKHYGVGVIDKSSIMPIDSALAVHMPYRENEPIESATISTAQDTGWIWDIGLSSRRGVGHVYSSSHCDRTHAENNLQKYLGVNDNQFSDLAPREISIKPGYRETFWHKNCVAVGLSAGFLEPLEASAIMLIETSVNMIASQFPQTRDAMDIVSKRFNQRTHYRWQRVIDFLQLHYYLSGRQESFWRDAGAGNQNCLSDRLREDLMLWQHQPPWKGDFDNIEEVFPSASYQYVLYGMGFKTKNTIGESLKLNPKSRIFYEHAESVVNKASLLIDKVVSNRDFLNAIS